MDELVRISKLEFTEIPDRLKRSPARTRNLQVRFYVDRFAEHAEAFSFLSDSKQTHGEGPKTLIRSLLHYRDTVISPPNGSIPLMLDFTPLPKKRSDRTKGVSIRLYIDKVAEHREAYEFLQEQQNLYGGANKTVIRALIHYKKTVIDPLSGVLL